MDIQEQRQGAVTVIKPCGPLALGDADQFKTTLLDAMSRSLGRLVIDATAMAYVDSRGLEVLVEASDEASQGGHALRVFGLNETVREVLELTDLTGKFEHFEDVTQAVRSYL
ncbi:MAG: STAS domain-containing protein [Phycisphaerales bacterium]|nr:MAG: STAS domain-containing protein [Phycisphaerales bacterium]